MPKLQKLTSKIFCRLKRLIKMANEIVPVNEMQGEVIFYQPDSTMRLEVRLEDETVWLTQQQMVDLFQSSKSNVSEHIRNIYDQGELEQKATVRNFRTVRKEGKYFTSCM